MIEGVPSWLKRCKIALFVVVAIAGQALAQDSRRAAARPVRIQPVFGCSSRICERDDEQRERLAEEPQLHRVGVADRGHARAHAPGLDQIEVAPEARLGFRVEFEGEAGCLGSEWIEAVRC